MTVMPKVVGTNITFPKGLTEGALKVNTRGRIETIQTTEIDQLEYLKKS